MDHHGVRPSLGGFLLLFGRAADLYGRRRWYIGGMALFTVSSLIGGLSTSPGMLLGARVGQGFASAMLTPAAMSLLTTSFPEGRQRDRALGINGTLLSLGFLTGVVLGGVITDLTNWRITLFINVPIGALALLAAPILIKESRNHEAPKLDVAGAVTVTGGLLAMIFGIGSAERNGWGSPLTLIRSRRAWCFSCSSSWSSPASPSPSSTCRCCAAVRSAGATSPAW